VACHHGFNQEVTEATQEDPDADISIYRSDTGSHWGRDKMMRMATSRWKFPPEVKVKQTLLDICSRCHLCALTKPLQLQKTGTQMQSIPRPTTPFLLWGIDCVGPFNVPSNGCKYIINAVDYQTKWVESSAIPDKKMETIAKFIFTHILCRYGTPRQILTDNGSEFVNQIMAAVTSLGGIEHVKIIPGNAKANGLCEHANGTMQKQLGKQIKPDERHLWAEHLPRVVWHMNSSINHSTKVSPFKMLFGVEPVLRVQQQIKEKYDFGTAPEDDEDDEEILPPTQDDRKSQYSAHSEILKVIRRKAAERNKTATAHQKKNFDKRHGMSQHPSPLVYEVGQKVYKYNTKDAARKEKGKPKWLGPFTIAARYPEKSAYKLHKDGHLRARFVPQCQLLPFLDANEKRIYVSAR
jgi:transposase InsO family protein